jgi:succinate-acetate transporter protein
MAVTPEPDGSGDDQVRATRVVLRPIANPFALGFLGLAGDTVTVAGMELGWISRADALHVGIIVLIFAPLLQVISCVFGFLGRDAVAATGMGVLAGTWACIGAIMLTSRPGATSHALGTFLFLAGAAVLVSANTAATAKLVPAIVLALAGLRFILTGIYQFIPTTPWKVTAGVAGLVLGFVAVYGSASLEVEGVRRAPLRLLPTLRHGAGREAIEGDLAAQVRHVAAEAGVRKQL